MSRRTPEIRALVVQDLIGYGLTKEQAEDLVEKAEEYIPTDPKGEL